MDDKRVWPVMNVALAVLAVLLTLNLVGVELPSVGKAEYLLDKNDPICFVDWQGEINPVEDLNRCCLEARQQVDCFLHEKKIGNSVAGWVCQSGENSIKFIMNNKQYNYCRLQRYWG